MAKKIHVIGGGTIFHIRPHLHIGAQAYGTTAKKISNLARSQFPWPEYEVRQHLTKMADPMNGSLITNNDVAKTIDEWIEDNETKIVFMSAALCDFTGSVPGTLSGKDQPRLKTSAGVQTITLTPADKIIGKIRKQRKDIFLIGFKTTAGVTADEQFEAGLLLLKKNSCNLVLANDVHTRVNMIVTPELARYSVTTNRDEALKELVTMTRMRQGLTFHRTVVKEGTLVSWNGEEVPEALRKVVNYCIDKGAYAPFNDITVGHFGYRIGENKFLSSRRKRNFNKDADRDLVETSIIDGSIHALGAKPSAGAFSQYMVLNRYQEFDCIVHFHCPQKPGSSLAVRNQKPFECGSVECGKNTTDGLKKIGNLGAVMLDKHGPNIVFSSKNSPNEVIKFIDEHFDLTKTTSNG